MTRQDNSPIHKSSEDKTERQNAKQGNALDGRLKRKETRDSQGLLSSHFHQQLRLQLR